MLGHTVTLQVNLKSIYLRRNGSIHASTHSVWKEMQILATDNCLLICGTGSTSQMAPAFKMFPRSDRKLFVMEILDEKCKTLPSSDAKVYAIQPQASRAQGVARLTFSKDR